MFSAAESYERFMGRWSRTLAKRMVAFGSVRDGESILDVGSGTGALTLAIVDAVPTARVVGVDRSAAFVAWAQAHSDDANVSFESGDAQHLPFGDSTFDRALSMLTLNFVPDPPGALREMRRVTRGGGVVAVAVWDYGSGMQMLRAFWDTVATLDPDADDERRMPLCGPRELAGMFHECGFDDTVEDALTIPTVFRSFDDYWLPFLEGVGPAGAYATALSGDARHQLRSALRRRLLGDGPDREIALTATARAVRGVVPLR